MSPSNANSRSDTASRGDKVEQSSSQPTETSSPVSEETAKTNADQNHGVFNSLKQAVLPYVKKYPHTVLYGLVGFVIAAFILIVGFWPTLLLVIGVTLGILIGRYHDGDRKVRARLKSLLDRIS